ncbi:MAG: FKBP-type peptidyl-prolyl cis-trans isomerase [Gemmatimonadota bacterium]|nr:FKBP-type peptidyl-prolyl cis-trans isomerase [Gemmatimonadota bacterium]
MRVKEGLVTAALAVVLAGCQAGDSTTVQLETEQQKASYGIGLGMGRQLAPVSEHIDLAAIRAGIEDAVAGRDPRITDEEIQAVMQAFNQTVQAEMQAEAEAEGQKNAEEGAAFLAENGAREGVVTTDSGLQYEVMREGEGASPTPADRVTIHYRGTLVDGTEFDSSYERGDPATFSVGGVIQGFSEGLQLMSVGSQYRFWIPGEIGYGLGGSPPDIGPNATLIFEVELLEIPAG